MQVTKEKPFLLRHVGYPNINIRSVQGQHQRLQPARLSSDAEVVKRGISFQNSLMSIQAKEVGNAWLYENLIIKLKFFFAFSDFVKECRGRGLQDTVIRMGSGRLAVLTFNSIQEMKSLEVRLKDWMFDWCDSLQERQAGTIIDQERCVWLSCFGIPFNLWNIETFRSLGALWGEVVQFDENNTRGISFQCGKVRIITSCMDFIKYIVLVKNKGKDYPVRVCENLDSSVVMERSVYQCDCRQMVEGASVNGGDQNSRDIHGSVVEGGGRCRVEGTLVGACVEKEVANGKKVPSQSNKAIEDDQKSWVSETIADVVGSSFEKPIGGANSRLRGCLLKESSFTVGGR
ncbi:unnamed protein product [Camellia sinensis]